MKKKSLNNVSGQKSSKSKSHKISHGYSVTPMLPTRYSAIERDEIKKLEKQILIGTNK